MAVEDRYETHEYDVVVVGAGGAGLRAAIEASAQGARTALVCKSLLGKAHTVMAEGGIAAALGNVWPEDNWKVHFRDTMRGGKLLNNWRMAQIHAQEAPDRVLELEEWGALFDRTKDGLILQRDFGGHRYARLAHVGDRTGLEMIRTLQQHAVHKGIDVYMECTIQRLLKDGDRVAGAFGYWRESGQVRAVQGARRWCWRPAASARSTRSPRTPGSTPATASRWRSTAGADLIDMEIVQFHPTGMVWPPSVRGILVTEGVRGDGGTLKNPTGERFMFNYIPEFFRAETADTEEEADAWYEDKDQPPHARAAAARRGRPGDQRRGQGRPRQPARRRLPRHRHRAATPSTSSAAAVDVPPVQGAGRRRHHQGADGGRPDLPLHDGRRAGRCRDGGDHACPACSRPARSAAGLHGANRLGGNSLSDLLVFGRRAGLYAAEYARRLTGQPTIDDARRSRPRAQAHAGAVRARRATRTRTPSTPTSKTACRTWSASSAPRPSWSRRSTRSTSCKAARWRR